MGYGTDINDLADRAHDYLVRNGFCAAKDDNPPTDLMLIVTETAEAMELYRAPDFDIAAQWVNENGKPEGFVIELADIIIRCIALAGHHNLNIQQAIWDKMAYNETRSFMHGGKRV